MANTKEIFVIRANGSVVGRRSGEWYSDGVLDTKMEPGDVVVVPQKIIGGSMFWRNMLATAQVLSSIAITANLSGSPVTALHAVPQSHCSVWRCMLSPVAIESSCAQISVSASARASSTSTPSKDNPANMASTYVPLDSWVYPVDRALAGSGLRANRLRRPTSVDAHGMRSAGNRGRESEQPRMPKRRRVRCIAVSASSSRWNSAAKMAHPNTAFQVESIYSQVLGISGRPVVDGYHFAQTAGERLRPALWRRDKLLQGAALRAVAGPIAFFVRGEYQNSGTVIPPSPSAQAAIAQADFTPAASAGPPSNVSRFRLHRRLRRSGLQEQSTVVRATITVVGTGVE